MDTRPPRWKKCVGAVKHALPGLVRAHLSLSLSLSLALSRSLSLTHTHTRGLQADDLYIQKLFSKKTKDDALQMMEHLRQAFVENLNSVCCVCVCACVCACVCVRACACTDRRGATTGELDGQ